ncbi:hypothetical protein ORI20_16695 [Mycobacterium sp. CVI_P3]|uniref:Uncharacterized protein n=1 Tax=Mycobacterium pinniadriaticum TaxID=2994102 RepID=A0ABT3SFH2_9MYCO|nr:hypothetical protein [Mycobacterium pinniadriaticum]MCX2931923.1 hypothetical protein [Mycobacterium pinniadriaticum]MCX2938266.1 hypothetical protein [Mycobacterium pinniadriaticum]
MSTTTELAELHHLIGGLRRCVTSLRARYGDAPAMRRIVNDAERILNDVELLDIDANELALTQQTAVGSGEKIGIPDTPYDTAFWRDVDDEGVGGHNRR